jgi:hypothetical protein
MTAFTTASHFNPVHTLHSHLYEVHLLFSDPLRNIPNRISFSRLPVTICTNFTAVSCLLQATPIDILFGIVSLQASGAECRLEPRTDAVALRRLLLVRCAGRSSGR